MRTWEDILVGTLSAGTKFLILLCTSSDYGFSVSRVQSIS